MLHFTLSGSSDITGYQCLHIRRTGRQKVNPKGVDETHFCPIFYTSQVSLYLCTKAGVFLKGLNITEKTILPLQFIDS